MSKRKQFGEVFTPQHLVDEMLDVLPTDVWLDKDKTWLDPCSGSNCIFPITVADRLIDSLTGFDTEEDKVQHIWENMIYMCELQEDSVTESLKLLKDKYGDFNYNIFQGSFLRQEFDVWIEEVDKFDIVVGNPPYQEMDGGHAASAKPLYHIFLLKALKITDKLIFVQPSRWMAGGKGLDKFRKEMFNLKSIQFIKHYEDSKLIFGTSVDIAGGIQILYIDNKYNGRVTYNGMFCHMDTYDVFVNPIHHSIINRVKNKPSLSSIGRSRSTYPIRTNDSTLTDSKIKATDLLCYVSKRRGFTKYVSLNKITRNLNTVNDYKVLTAAANGSSTDCFGNTFLGLPNEVHTDTYIHFKVNNKIEGDNLVVYLNTKFANYLLSLRKISQHIKPDTCKWIPLVDLSKEWTDEELYGHFNLTQEEIKLIEQTVK